jgi:hypothetical protein
MTPRKIAHLELYDWTFTTWEVMMALNSFEQSPARQAVAAAWMQSMPAEELDTKHAAGLVEAGVKQFRIEFPLAALNDVIDWFTAQTKQIEERRVDVVSRSTSTESDAPKN